MRRRKCTRDLPDCFKSLSTEPSRQRKDQAEHLADGRRRAARETPHRPVTSAGTAEWTSSSDRETPGQIYNRPQDIQPSGLLNHSKGQKESSRVTFQFDESEEIPESVRPRLPTLLGYDWIAGILDVEDSLIEYSDEFLDDLRMFRSRNKDQCFHSSNEEFCEVLPPMDKTSPEDNDTHQCMFFYRINSRLFPVPIYCQEVCPVCKRHKSSHPHTAAEPALIRVGIPSSLLLQPYKYQAHRRGSFDPSDSLGLPAHCLLGWSNKCQRSKPPPSSLDLRSSLHMKRSAGSQSKDLKVLSEPQNHVITPLARHNFHHLSPKQIGK